VVVYPFFSRGTAVQAGLRRIKNRLPGKVVYPFLSKGEDMNIKMDKFPSFGGVRGVIFPFFSRGTAVQGG